MPCPFCMPEKEIGDRLIYRDKNWYAFVPNEPEIFGHIMTLVKSLAIGRRRI